MLTAIELDHQTFFTTTKVDNEAAYRMLTAKLVTAELRCAKTRPEVSFRIGLATTKVPRSIPK